MIKKAIIYNNPFLAFKYHADIDFISGAVIYKRYNPNRTCYRYVLKELQKNWLFRLFSRQSLKK